MTITENIFPLEWSLKDPLKVEYHGKKVFGTFVCGGGSTMGYKLAGYEHLGGGRVYGALQPYLQKESQPKIFLYGRYEGFCKSCRLARGTLPS